MRSSADNGTTLRLLEKAPDETLTGFQIFGSRAAVAAAAVRRIAPLAPAIIDLNCGCSVPKVLKAGLRRRAPAHPGPDRRPSSPP